MGCGSFWSQLGGTVVRMARRLQRGDLESLGLPCATWGLETWNDLSDFCQPVLKAGQARAATPQTSQLVLCIRQGLARAAVSKKYCKSTTDAAMQGSVWPSQQLLGMDMFYHNNINCFVYSMIETFVRLNSAVRLQYFHCGLLKQCITIYMIMDGFSQGVKVFILHFLLV